MRINVEVRTANMVSVQDYDTATLSAEELGALVLAQAECCAEGRRDYDANPPPEWSAPCLTCSPSEARLSS